MQPLCSSNLRTKMLVIILKHVVIKDVFALSTYSRPVHFVVFSTDPYRGRRQRVVRHPRDDQQRRRLRRTGEILNLFNLWSEACASSGLKQNVTWQRLSQIKKLAVFTSWFFLFKSKCNKLYLRPVLPPTSWWSPMKLSFNLFLCHPLPPFPPTLRKRDAACDYLKYWITVKGCSS